MHFDEPNWYREEDDGLPYIFISYRWADSRNTVGRLYDRINEDFHKSRIFRDIHNIEAGEIFDTVCEEAVKSCKVFIAVIGEHWLSITDKEGRRRLDNPDDLVRREIALALSQKDTLVIPTLVEGATLPNKDDLPDDLKPLLQHNMHEIRDRDFAYDIEKFMRTINETLPLGERLRKARWGGKITYEQEMKVRQSLPEFANDLFYEMLQDAPARKRLLDEMRTETMRDILEALKNDEEGTFRIGCTLVTRNQTCIKIVIECPIASPRSTASELPLTGWRKNDSGQWYKECPLDDEYGKHQLVGITSEIIKANEHAGVSSERIHVHKL